MLRTFLPLALLLLAWLPALPAQASGDFTCYPSYELKHTARDDCSNTAFLSPGNDSRINLLMLMQDQRGASPAKDDSGDEALFTLEDFTTPPRPPGAPAPDADAAPSDSSLADGEGGRCISNTRGRDAFEAAVNSVRGLPDPEKKVLVTGRYGVSSDCNGGNVAKLAGEQLSIRSAPGRQFADYLTGAAAFYDGDFDAAHAKFAALGGSDIAWIRQAARYMLGRVELNRAQIHAFDDYSDQPSETKVDTASLAAAEAGFRAYLHDYPQGDYASSARGLLRRVYWLGGQSDRLSAEYARLISVSTGDAAPGLAQEIDTKLLKFAEAATIKSPALLAAQDLMGMRSAEAPASPSDAAPAKPDLSLADLQAQRPAFAKDPVLFDYLLAAHHFYVGKDPASALALLPADPAGAGASNLAFSRQVLRGLALEAAKDGSARAHWTQLYPAARRPFQKGAIELALAMHYERAGELAPVFAPGSLVRNVAMRDILLRHAAGPPLLRALAGARQASEHDRNLALYILLYKEITRGRYQAFLQDIALLPHAPPAQPAQGAVAPQTPDPDDSIFDWTGGGQNAEEGYVCPALIDVARTLARASHDPHGLMCLEEFVRENGLDGAEPDGQPPADELGGAASQFPGSAPSRLETYRQVIADPKAPGADRAYALYRAVVCYEPTGANHCDGPGVAQSERKQWFKTLKSTYAGSPWANALKYYW